MQGVQGDDRGDGLAAASGEGASVRSDGSTSDESETSRERAAEPAAPVLPEAATGATPSVVTLTAAPTRRNETWYRSDQDRFRSVRRRANPWYRRLARAAIGLSFLAAAGIGLFFGARVVQDYLDRDRLPGPGADVPEIRATSFELRSSAPAPALDGTLTLDAVTKAFEFTGRGTGPLAGTQVVSPDGAIAYVRRGAGSWERTEADDPVVAEVARAVDYLADDVSADAILTSHLRRGYADLIGRTEVGIDGDEIRRYELRLDTRSFEADFPLQYQQFESRAIPGVQPVRGLTVTIAIDDDDVLVGVDDADTNWVWQRLAYSDQSFAPIDPTGGALGNTVEITDGTVDDG